MRTSPPRRITNPQPVIIRGAPFHFRTLHPLDVILPRNRPHRAMEWLPTTLDREQTFTLAAVPGLYHCRSVTMEVIL